MRNGVFPHIRQTVQFNTDSIAEGVLHVPEMKKNNEAWLLGNPTNARLAGEPGWLTPAHGRPRHVNRETMIR